ncbi:PaaI family thioesterase [Streptomyces sp. NBC_00322]|uniref:PaaI family thioesterase n=1 Tax=Streptomyces sp. NBC_00322 TaxID=2975712 RepID=UPI002E2B0019|nr:PaaI family thioesterase [Streptomyces sp. NBC_00322]
MASAVHTTLPAGIATLELSINYVRAARTDGQILSAEGVVVHADRWTALAQGKVVDEQGKPVGAVGQCRRLPRRPGGGLLEPEGLRNDDDFARAGPSVSSPSVDCVIE